MKEMPLNLNLSSPSLMTESEPTNWYSVCLKWHSWSPARALCSIECGVVGKCWVCGLTSVMLCGAMKMVDVG